MQLLVDIHNMCRTGEREIQDAHAVNVYSVKRRSPTPGAVGSRRSILEIICINVCLNNVVFFTNTTPRGWVKDGAVGMIKISNIITRSRYRDTTPSGEIHVVADDRDVGVFARFFGGFFSAPFCN